MRTNPVARGAMALACALVAAFAAPAAAAPAAKTPTAKAPVHASGVNRLDRKGLSLTFEDQFDRFDWDDPRAWKQADPVAAAAPAQKPPTWRTWFHNGEDPYGLHNRTLPGNKEMQFYADPALLARIKDEGGPELASPISVKDGHLLIRATKASAAMRGHIWNRDYVSGMVTTWGSFSQKYGVFEMRAKLPAGRGVWPSFWLMPADGSWPPEIDVFEFLGHDVHTLYAGYMTHGPKGALWGNHVTKPVIDLTQGFHTYAVDWGPKIMVFYLDDVEIARWPTPKDMHGPMFMIASLAVGGKWGGPPDATTRFPATLDIDWIRAWSRAPRTPVS